jgi:hypothetical protein
MRLIIGLSLCLLPSIIIADDAQLGVDISVLLTSDAATCLADAGITSVTPRGFRSSGVIDDNACKSLKHAKTANITYRDVYMFPCPTCSATPAEQLATMVDNLEANCPAKWTQGIWLDVEGAEYWTGSNTANRAWYEDLVDACITASKTYGYHCGVYASSAQWVSLFGSTDYCYGSGLKLWYPHYDNDASFDDYTEFGCWKTPVLKQYAGDTTQCSISVDKNYGNPNLGPTPTPVNA